MAVMQSAPLEILPGITISLMTEHDLLEVVEIEESSGLSQWGWDAYHAEMQSGNRNLMLVARSTGPREGNSPSMAAYIVARLGADELHINNMAVRAPFRRRGIGAALLRRILEQGKRLGVGAAFLEVRAGNAAAQALYESCGLRVVGRRPRYYSNPSEDALIMSIDLRS
jgi:[ribosomal protein S18]-alanine N-acetyltransferase